MSQGTLRGNWGAVLAAVATALGVALVVNLSVVFLFDPAGTSAWDNLVISVTGALGVFTVDGVFRLSADDGSVAAGVGTVPLLVTTLSLGAAGYVFRRLTRDTAQLRDALLDALRAALVLGALALLLSLAFRSRLTGLTDEASDLLRIFGVGDLEMALGSNRVTSFFVTGLVTFATLAGASLLRRDWLPAAGQRLHDRLAPPVRGLGALVALLPLAGVVSYLVLLTGELPEAADTEDLAWNQKTALGLAGVSNAGLHYLGLGSGARVGAGYRLAYEGGEERDEWYGRLPTVVAETGMWGMWLAVPVALAVLAAAALVVVRTSRDGSRLAALGTWCGVMVVGFPWLARLTSFRVSGDLQQGDDEATFEAFLGLPSSSALLLAAVGIGVTLVVAAAARLNRLRAAG